LAARPGQEKSDTGKEPAKGPQVWKRDRQRPTFARVYVGDNTSLELVSLQVTVTVEGPRARTLVDHIFRNPHDRQLEGTFEYPLPTGASPAYFAMFLGQSREAIPARFGPRGDTPPLPQEALARLAPADLVKQVNTADWGRLQEARVVAREKALEAYEEVVRGRIDPALLEYAGGNTFSGRVFPIPPKGYNRVLIAYEELLPAHADRVVYRYPLPDCKLAELQLTLQAHTADGHDFAFRPEDAKKEEGGGQVVFRHRWTDKGPGGEAVFAYTPVNPELQAISGRQGESGPRYVYARIRPTLKAQADKPFAEHGVFLLDTSLSEHPDRFAVNLKLLRKILESDTDLKQFNVLAFNAGAAWVEPKGWLPNTPAGRETLFQRLDGIVLEGATDFASALEKLVRPGFEIKPGTPLNVFVLSDGQITWGEPDVAPVVARFEARCPFATRFHCYRLGLGAENQELFEALTRRGGGVFDCFSDTQLAAAAQAHRNQCLLLSRVGLTGAGVSDAVVVGSAVYPGGGVLVAAKTKEAGKVTVTLEGQFLGQQYAQEYVLDASGSAELAPRGWAEVAVAELLSLNDSKLDSLVTAYCQQFGVGSRVASFLVLENDSDYKRLDLEAERGKTLPGDLGAFLQQAWQALGKPTSARAAFERFLAQVGPRLNLTAGADATNVKRLLALLAEDDFELPGAPLAGAILTAKDVPPAYLAARDADRRNVQTYLTEARRRKEGKDLDGAVRVLSSIIEEYPARGDALRLVGYRLLDLRQAAQAARLFAQVQRSRPFEPHSYRDLARALEEEARYPLAALQYELVLAGNWHARFHHDSLKLVVREEYARMMREAIALKAVNRELANFFGERLERMDPKSFQADLRVSISWNTDATDVDLWVIEPDGFKVYYQATRSPSGGELSQDQTQGYGPERYQIARARRGTYVVKVHYFAANPNLLAGETHVNVVVTRHAGTPQETVQRHTVILKKHGEEVEVCKIDF
jgi:tetratricopeptide (TPR) repeat protein